jgi:hypothetical protein
MNKIKLIPFGLIFVSALHILLSCSNPFTANGPQPSYLEENSHANMLNVFGVLRNTQLENKPLSFVHVEAVQKDETFYISDAEVVLYLHEQDIIADSVILRYTDYDSLFDKPEYRDEYFIPLSGEKYGISCMKEGYPRVQATTIVPEFPEIKGSSLQIGQKNVDFVIPRDPLAAAYDIVVNYGYNEEWLRIKRPETGDIYVDIQTEKDLGEQFDISIYAYDLNLSEYISFNVTIKPNTYQPLLDLLDNGIGCFGSISEIHFEVNVSTNGKVTKILKRYQYCSKSSFRQ